MTQNNIVFNIVIIRYYYHDLALKIYTVLYIKVNAVATTIVA